MCKESIGLIPDPFPLRSGLVKGLVKGLAMPETGKGGGGGSSPLGEKNSN